MFNDIFSHKPNRLVHRGPETPKGKPPTSLRAAMGAEQYVAEMGRILDRALARAPESPKDVKARAWIDQILHSSGTRKRYEMISAKDAKEMVVGVGKEIASYMAGKQKDTLLNRIDGSTLLLEKTPTGGIIAVVVEGGTKIGGPKQAPVYITIGEVPDAYDKHLAMAEEFNKTPTAKKQNVVAATFHAGPGGQARRMTERYVASKG